VQEKCDFNFVSGLFAQTADEVGGAHEMVVVDPDQRHRVGLRLAQLLHGLKGEARELLVHLEVGLPLVLLEQGAVRHGVEQRPEARVAAPVVVVVEEGPADVGGHDLRALEAGGGALVVGAGLRHGPHGVLRVQARPAHPQAPRLHHHGGHRRHQAPGTLLSDRFPFLILGYDEWQSVRHHNHG